jgi:putative ATP-dependent endonuclease of the OLD family
MKVSLVTLKNFRRLEDVEFTLETDNTIFVGPNNSGKTSVTAAFRLFFKRSDFSISDFNVACTRAFDRFGADPDFPLADLPKIQLDIWLDIDPKQIEFGRAFALVPNLGVEHDTVGIRLSFEAPAPEAIKNEFKAAFPDGKGKTLTEYLALDRNLARHFAVQYYALERGEKGDIAAALIEPEEGRRVLHGLIRLDFIDAQRNMHDEDSARHNRLSSAFAAYYRHNLEKPAENAEATRVIDENNASLTGHYEKHFAKLLKTVAVLGVPSAHDRRLRLVSSLSPQEALQGSTELYYEDAENHRLPEAYNGLGFKNLVYMAIQVSHYHAQWMTTEVNKPLCQLIFIEEPEVHLHAQVQQVFIANIYRIIEETAKDAGEKLVLPQLILSTHSSHVVDTVDFEKVRYFCRCPLKFEKGNAEAPLVASKVLNLANFQASADTAITLTPAEEKGLDRDGKKALLATKAEQSRISNLHFLRRYIKLTHCDLFFADAAVLVEGTAEKLLMGQMIAKSAPELEFRYITVLEVGGAYAHRFVTLMAFLGIPYVVITDIDTVDAADARKACRADTPEAHTSNASLKHFFGVKERAQLVALDTASQIVEGGRGFVTFQRPVRLKLDGAEVTFHGRTLEEQFVYDNLALFRINKLLTGEDFAKSADAAAISEETYKTVQSKTFKKTEFALGVALSEGWVTPTYIADGLKWLEQKLVPAIAPAKGAEPIAKAAE